MVRLVRSVEDPNEYVLVEAFEDDAALEKEYYPESIALIKELTGASRVVVFDHSECLISGMSFP